MCKCLVNEKKKNSLKCSSLIFIKTGNKVLIALIKTADGQSFAQPNPNRSFKTKQRCDKKAQQGACVISGEREKCQRKLSNKQSDVKMG